MPHPAAVAALALAALLPPTQDGRHPPRSSPLASFGRLTEGQWRAGRGEPLDVHHRFDPGAGGRTIRVRAYLAGEAGDAPISESVYFFHPGEREVLGLGFGSAGSLFESRLDFRDGAWAVDLRHHAAGETRRMVERWEWPHPDHWVRTSFLVEGRERTEWRSTTLRREARGDGTLDGAPGADVPAGRLAPLARLVGAAWETEGVGPDGRRFQVRDVYSWGVGKRAVHERTYDVTAYEAGGSGAQVPRGEPTVETWYYWHPVAQELRFVAVAASGAVDEGSLRAEGPADSNVLWLDSTSHAPRRRPVRHAERLELLADGSLDSQLWKVTDDRRDLLLRSTYARRQAPGR